MNLTPWRRRSPSAKLAEGVEPTLYTSRQLMEAFETGYRAGLYRRASVKPPDRALVCAGVPLSWVDGTPDTSSKSVAASPLQLEVCRGLARVVLGLT